MFSTLEGLLAWVISGGGAGVLAYVFIDHMPVEIPNSKLKRLVAFVVTAALAILAYAGTVAAGYAPECVTAVCWAEEIVQVLCLAFGLGQGIHGVRDLPASKE